jgi:hypothetical protein
MYNHEKGIKVSQFIGISPPGLGCNLACECIVAAMHKPVEECPSCSVLGRHEVEATPLDEEHANVLVADGAEECILSSICT